MLQTLSVWDRGAPAVRAEPIPQWWLGRLQVAAEANWRDPDATLPGQGDPCQGDGDLFMWRCTVGQDHTAIAGYHEGGRRDCCNCGTTTPDPENPEKKRAGYWLRERANELSRQAFRGHAMERLAGIPTGNGGLDLNGNRMDLRQATIAHVVLSFASCKRGMNRIEVTSARRDTYQMLRERGATGAVLVYHENRCLDTSKNAPDAHEYAKLGPHFHALVTGRWLSVGPPTRKSKLPKTPQAKYRYHGKEGWVRVENPREPIEGVVFKIVWAAKRQAGNRDVWITRFFSRKERWRTGSTTSFERYIRRVSQYLLHHATFFRGSERVPDDWDVSDAYKAAKPVWHGSRYELGRHPTPASVCYGRMRQPPTTDAEKAACDDVDQAWLPQGCKECPDCGAPMERHYEDPEADGAKAWSWVGGNHAN